MKYNTLTETLKNVIININKKSINVSNTKKISLSSLNNKRVSSDTLNSYDFNFISITYHIQ
ncbi:hypothetical protein [Methanosphaera sp.]|uniref:hypothetical protein n=1 Tax=Methanosphaera sp. TaxID=2666342 RepID=UPI003D944978